MKSFFDQPYYRLNKLFMSQMGIWPEQSLLVRCILPPVHIGILVSVMIPELIRMHDVWGNPAHIINCLPPLLVIVAVFTKLLNASFNVHKFHTLLNQMKNHWTEMVHSPNIEILHKCGSRAHFITLAYAIYIYASMTTYLILPIIPVILDIVNPLNESRPRKFLYEAEYGINEDKYFYEILFHSYLTTVSAIAILVTVDSMYFTIVGHACGLFEMVGANMNRADKSIERSFEADYKRIRYCVELHKEALRFADLIETTFSTAFMSVIGLSLITMSLSALQTFLNIHNPDDVVRFGSFVISQVIHVFFNSLPGQKIIDYSLEVQQSVYDSDWIKFHKKNQKLVLIILMRSQKPCLFTAGKVYIMSMESFSSVMQTAMSYFTVFATMV